MSVRRRGERGETLVELLATIVIMSLAIIAVVAGIAVATNSSDEQKKQVGVVVVLRNYAEAIMNGTYAGGCSDPVVTFAQPPGYTTSIAKRAWYDGISGGGTAAFSDTCPGAAARAVRLTLDARSNDTRAHRTLQIVRVADYARPS